MFVDFGGFDSAIDLLVSGVGLFRVRILKSDHINIPVRNVLR